MTSETIKFKVGQDLPNDADAYLVVVDFKNIYKNVKLSNVITMSYEDAVNVFNNGIAKKRVVKICPVYIGKRLMTHSFQLYGQADEWGYDIDSIEHLDAYMNGEVKDNQCINTIRVIRDDCRCISRIKNVEDFDDFFDVNAYIRAYYNYHNCNNIPERFKQFFGLVGQYLNLHKLM